MQNWSRPANHQSFTDQLPLEIVRKWISDIQYYWETSLEKQATTTYYDVVKKSLKIGIQNPFQGDFPNEKPTIDWKLRL